MFAQQNKLKELFGEHGWELVESQQPNNDWIAEIWLLKSLWSPTDCFVFIEFLVDDQWEDRFKKTEGVSAINLTLKQPEDWRNDDFEIESSIDEKIKFYIKPNFEKYIAEIYEGLNLMRLKFKEKRIALA